MERYLERLNAGNVRFAGRPIRVYLSGMPDLDELEQRLSDERIKVRDSEIALLREQLLVVCRTVNDETGTPAERMAYLKNYLAQ